MATAAFAPSIVTTSATSIPDLGNAGIFELDGNVAQDTVTPPPYDWTCVFTSPATASCPPPSTLMISKAFLPDYVTPDPTYFVPTKDILDVSTWSCKTEHTPTKKDDIQNAYGATFIPTSGPKAGHVLVYLAQERLSSKGDSFAGFWLMQHDHTCSGTASFSGGGHDTGDLLVVSNYTNGGKVATIKLYSWDPTNVSAVNNLVELGSGFTCGQTAPITITSPDDICGITNDAPMLEPWAPNNTLDANAFVEVGVDMTDLFPATVNNPLPCFGGLLAETRSSQELTATLKDFASSRLSLCADPTVTTKQTANNTSTAAQTVEVGTAVTDRATLTGTFGTPGGTVTYNLYSNDTCTGTPTFSSGPFTVTGSGAQHQSAAFTPNAVGVYQWQVSYSGDNATGGRNNPALSTCGDEPLTAVDAKIAITPATAVNAVGNEHVFTITMTALPGVARPVGFGAITASVSPTPDLTDTSTCNAPSVVANVATCTLTINSSTAGTFTANAAGTVTIANVVLNRSTDGSAGPKGPGGSGAATKRYVDASVAITPQSAVNAVGVEHVFTITVTAMPSGASPVSFGTITASVSPTPTSHSTTCNAPNVVANVATCTLTIDNNAVGTFTANASAQVTMGGVLVMRSTSGSSGHGGSGPGVKSYGHALISIAPDGVNEVGKQHVFTVTVLSVPNTVTTLTSIVANVTPSPTSQSTTCGSAALVNGVATCTVTINSSSAGIFTASAAANLVVNGEPVTVNTDGLNGNSGPATKRYVTAAIALSPATADNPVGSPHTLTATVTGDDGSGSGPAHAPDGTVVHLTVLSGPGSLASPTCTTSGGTGTCTDVLTSTLPGTSVVNAAVDLVVHGVALHRATADGVPGDSANAVKNWHKVQPGIATTQSAGGAAGIAVSDTATVSGGLSPTGTVSFRLFAPGDTSCTGTPVFTATGRPLSGGTAQSGSFTPTAAGTYHWVATYSGDASNLGAVSGCGDEPVTIIAGGTQGILPTPTPTPTPAPTGGVQGIISTPNTGGGPTGSNLLNATIEGSLLILAGSAGLAWLRRRQLR